jgi:hypothetical protein
MDPATTSEGKEQAPSLKTETTDVHVLPTGALHAHGEQARVSAKPL